MKKTTHKMVKKTGLHKKVNHPVRRKTMAKKDVRNEPVKEEVKSAATHYSCGCVRVDVGVALGICPEHRCP